VSTRRLAVAPARPSPPTLLAALLAGLLAGASVLAPVLAGDPAPSPPRGPAAPVATPVATPVAADVSALAAARPTASEGAWAWPLDATGGAPAVLRPATLPTHPWQPGHRGVDLAAAPGQAVLAPVDGVVVAAGRVAGRGVVSIRSASGWRATLEPVDPAVAVGEVVSRGQVVGALSAPGAGGAQHCGGASCLHWGVRTGSGARVVYRDPLALLRRPVRLLPVPGWAVAQDGLGRAADQTPDRPLGRPVSWPRTASRASR